MPMEMEKGGSHDAERQSRFASGAQLRGGRRQQAGRCVRSLRLCAPCARADLLSSQKRPQAARRRSTFSGLKFEDFSVK